jgi:imidazolonepropionase-like amidohydrolase
MAWAEAQEYKRAWDKYDADYEAGLNPEAPVRDIKHDTLRAVIEGEVLIHNHCYKAEEMAMMIDLSKEFNYKITAFHHAVEAYKIADLLADEGICAALWADWWGFKHEAFDMVWENAAIVDQANAGTGCAIIHSDSSVGIQRLNQEAAKAMAAGNRAGFNIPPSRAIQWITSNPAKALGIDVIH